MGEISPTLMRQRSDQIVFNAQLVVHTLGSGSHKGALGPTGPKFKSEAPIFTFGFNIMTHLVRGLHLLHVRPALCSISMLRPLPYLRGPFAPNMSH